MLEVLNICLLKKLLNETKPVFNAENDFILAVIDINECKGKPCQNGVTCVNTFGSYRCQCASGYNGQHCQAGIVAAFIFFI